MSDIANLQNPFPILQQPRSNITTNPFIPNEQKQYELEVLEKNANEIVEKAYMQNKTSSISNLSVKTVIHNTANSFVGVLNDLFEKPKEVNFINHVLNILQKEQRYAYIGLIFIIIALYMEYVKNN